MESPGSIFVEIFSPGFWDLPGSWEGKLNFCSLDAMLPSPSPQNEAGRREGSSGNVFQQSHRWLLCLTLAAPGPPRMLSPGHDYLSFTNIERCQCCRAPERHSLCPKEVAVWFGQAGQGRVRWKAAREDVEARLADRCLARFEKSLWLRAGWRLRAGEMWDAGLLVRERKWECVKKERPRLYLKRGDHYQWIKM